MTHRNRNKTRAVSEADFLLEHSGAERMTRELIVADTNPLVPFNARRALTRNRPGALSMTPERRAEKERRWGELDEDGYPLVLRYRKPCRVLPQERFNLPRHDSRSRFDPEILTALYQPRMAGAATPMTPDRLRDGFRANDFDTREAGWLRELIKQLCCRDLKLFLYGLETTVREAAAVFERCEITYPRAVELLNCTVPGHISQLEGVPHWFARR